MLSPVLLLKLSDIAWKAEECLVAVGDCGLVEVDEDGFSDRGKGSAVDGMFKFRSAIFEDGGTGRIGMGRMSLVGPFAWLLCPSVRISIEPLLATGKTTGAIVTGNVGTGNPPALPFRCECNWGGETVSWWTWSSSNIVEPINYEYI